MPRYVISVRGEVREQYVVTAESEAEARQMFDRSEAGEPRVSEVHDPEIHDVEEIEGS